MLPECATFDDGSNGVSGDIGYVRSYAIGALESILECQEWLDEFHQYHRCEGRVIKEKDDLICASRYALMMKIFSISKPGYSSWKYTPRKVI